MSRKRKTSADRAKLARSNDYDDNKTFADDAEILKSMTDDSQDSYREALKIWAEEVLMTLFRQS